MAEDIRKKLADEVLPVEWEVLRLHAERDRLFFVDAELPLVEVGCALALDDSAQLAAWIEAGRLRRPSAEEMGMDPTRIFQFLIVQPFVLVHDEGR